MNVSKYPSSYRQLKLSSDSESREALSPLAAKKLADSIGLLQGPLGEQLKLIKRILGLTSKLNFEFVPLIPPDTIIFELRNVFSFQETFQILGFCLGRKNDDFERVAKEMGGHDRLKQLASRVTASALQVANHSHR